MRPPPALLFGMSSSLTPATPAPIVGSHAPSLERLRALSRLLDSAFTIPGTRYRYGIDALIGLVPGLGDGLSALISGYIIIQASRLGAPRTVITRMIANVAVDTVFGWVPVIGDIFDVAWKSNLKNMALLETHLENPAAARRGSRQALLLLGGVLVVLFAGAIALGVLVAQIVLDLLR